MRFRHPILVTCLMAALCGCGDKTPPKATAISVPKDNSRELKDTFATHDLTWRTVEGKWSWENDGSTPVLKQTSTDHIYPVILLDQNRFTDVDVSVLFKPMSGKEDASGGIVFRARDDKNYYVVRANALEGNFRLYKVVDGDRQQIDGSQTDPPSLGQWHTLHLVASGNHIQAWLDDKMMINFEDSTYRSGAVGLWTKRDSVTAFTDFAVSGRSE